jgi:hypothetical protein
MSKEAWELPCYGHEIYLRAAEVTSRAADADTLERTDTEELLRLSLIVLDKGFLKQSCLSVELMQVENKNTWIVN